MDFFQAACVFIGMWVGYTLGINIGYLYREKIKKWQDNIEQYFVTKKDL